MQQRHQATVVRLLDLFLVYTEPLELRFRVSNKWLFVRWEKMNGKDIFCASADIVNSIFTIQVMVTIVRGQ